MDFSSFFDRSEDEICSKSSFREDKSDLPFLRLGLKAMSAGASNGVSDEGEVLPNMSFQWIFKPIFKDFKGEPVELPRNQVSFHLKGTKVKEKSPSTNFQG